MASPKILDEHREYLYQTVKLQFFFLNNWLSGLPEETLSAALRNRIDIYRKTLINKELLNPVATKFDCPEWLELEHRLKFIYEQYKYNAAVFEDAAFAVFKQTIDERVEKDYKDECRLVVYQCGSLSYNEHEGNLKQETTSFHIANALQPESIFTDLQYLPQCFLEQMRQTGKMPFYPKKSSCSFVNMKKTSQGEIRRQRLA